jgi:pimeloyl-ACP methyl ester carboxylesterase
MQKRRFAGGVVVSFTLCASAAPTGVAGRAFRSIPDTDAGPTQPCGKLSYLRLPDVRITEAVAVPAATTGPIHAPHCRVTGVVGTEIQFRLLLPDTWNGKFLMGGGGGFVGAIDNQAQRTVDAGYATVGTDTGHQGDGTDASWALDNIERQVNFGYVAIHRTAEVAKAIVRAYFGTDATHNYFVGCSNGGRQALMEAQRYPDDFDGIVVGAPALDFVALGAQFIKDSQVSFPDAQNTTPLFTVEALKSVETQIVDRCDAMDGLKDGLMEDPRRCAVDVARLSGLTDVQRAALKKVYAETRGKNGVIYPAQPFGGEGTPAGWPAWITGGASPEGPQSGSLRRTFGTQFFKYFVFGDPSWDYTKYDVSNAPKDARLAGTILNATNTNLDAFTSRGHKLVMWHGWSDPALSALATISYYEQVQARDANLRDYFRLFMMPGVLHCGGGPGPDNVDWPSIVVDWVEHAKAPDRIIARKLGAGGAVTRSRPVCPYQQHAVYDGKGPADAADSFICR